MAKINKLKKIIDGVLTTIYPVTIPQAVVDPANNKTLTAKLSEVDDSISETNTNLSQLSAELNLKDAEQSSQIKEIENVLSTANINQATTLSVMGRKTISLPKNASNGGMQVKLEGLTAENLVVNGDFRDGTTGWGSFSFASISVANGILSNTGNNLYSTPRILKYFNISSTDKYYVKHRLRVTNPNVISVLIGTIEEPQIHVVSSPVGYQWYDISGVWVGRSGTGLRITHTYVDAASANGKTMEVDYSVMINLTAIFGPGNEPTVEQCDAMFSSYFEGKKNFIPTGRVRSVGKNLFNKNIFIPNKVVLGGGTLNNSTTSNVSNYIRIQGGGAYSISGRTLSTFIAFYDNGYGFISSTSGLNITMSAPTNAVFARFSIGYADMNTCKFERGTVPTPYEPFKETNLYLTAPELRSNGLIKDEIRKGNNGYELVKRVGVATLGGELVSNGGFDTASGWSVVGESSISNGAARVYTSDGASTYVGQIAATLSATKGYKVKFDVIASNGQDLHLSGTGSIISPTPVKTGVSKLFVGNGSYLQFRRTQVVLTDVTIDNVSLKEIIPQDGAILSTSTFTELSDGTILYTLSTPQIIPISYGGVLNSAENGTVYHEPIIADAGVYETNIPILLTDYPISSLEEIIKHEGGIDTYLDVATSVIAGDGLSFTHPALASGDLVLFTYAFSKESTNGQLTATFFDSNVVKIDTVTGKAYKITDVVTNGILTRTLTEV